MNRPYPKFKEWLEMREGLWLADKNAVAGMSRIDPLSAPKTKLKPLAHTKSKTPGRFKVGHVSKPAFQEGLRETGNGRNNSPGLKHASCYSTDRPC
jgi:hypothetical protein